MLVVISYDVMTSSGSGQKRLRHVSKACLDYGLRVQYSVFECCIDPGQWAVLKHRLIDIIDQEKDSLRFYYLGANWKRRVEHIGAKKVLNIEEDPMII